MREGTADILLLDDGELGALSALLQRMGIEHRRLRGGKIDQPETLPRHLLVTTPRRAASVAGKPPKDAPPGKPVKVVCVEEDSPTVRAMLRERGFELLVRQPAHAEVWRLLVQRALGDEDDRRQDERIAVGSAVDVETLDEQLEATLIDISNRGCRVGCAPSLRANARITLELSGQSPESEPLRLPGRVIRIQKSSSGSTAAVLFDTDLSGKARRMLANLLNSWTRSGYVGQALTSAPPLPPCKSPVEPGLTLDEETDPPIAAGEIHVLLRLPPERRDQPRAHFSRTVRVAGAVGRHVLMGRDLSAGGMRLEPCPELRVGDELCVSIWGPARSQPHRLPARIVRDDGERGLGLVFLDVPPGVASDLEKIVACLPDVEPLQDGEAQVLGAVIAEIVGNEP